MCQYYCICHVPCTQSSVLLYTKSFRLSMDGHTMQTAPALVPLAEVKLHLARLVVRWVTTCEVRVLSVFVFQKKMAHRPGQKTAKKKTTTVTYRNTRKGSLL